jgi:hypothetical protein
MTMGKNRKPKKIKGGGGQDISIYGNFKLKL